MPKEQRPDEWDLVRSEGTASIELWVRHRQPSNVNLAEMAPEEAREGIWPKIEEKYRDKEVQLGVEALRNLERYIMLNIVDAQWKDHLLALDHLKEGIGLRGYGQKDPLVEYKRESYLFVSGDARSNRHGDDPISIQLPGAGDRARRAAVTRAPPPPTPRPRRIHKGERDSFRRR